MSDEPEMHPIEDVAPRRGCLHPDEKPELLLEGHRFVLGRLGVFNFDSEFEAAMRERNKPTLLLKSEEPTLVMIVTGTDATMIARVIREKNAERWAAREKGGTT